MTKAKLGTWLLLSLIPAMVLFVLSGALSPDTLFEGEFFWSFVNVIVGLYWLCALPAGIVASVWGRLEERHAYRETERYAELHGWLPISRTSWRNRKRRDVQLAVNRSAQKPTYILTIIADGETTVIDEFERAVWALGFGDWLWEFLVESNTKVDVDVVAEKRAEWEQTNAMAVYRGS